MDQHSSIISLIPQKPPFVMVDELLYAAAGITRTTFTITDHNPLTSKGSFTEGGMLENIAQTAAAGAGYQAQQLQQPVRAGYIGAVKNFVIQRLPLCGEQLETEVRIEQQVFDMTVVTGTIHCRGEQIAACEMKIFLV